MENNLHFHLLFGHAGWGQKFHDIACVLHQRDDSYQFSGISFGLEAHKVLSNQKNIEYVNLSSYEDLYTSFLHQELDEEYLVVLEKRYGTLWKYAYADRQLITYNHNKRASSYDLDRSSVLKVVQGVFKYYEGLVINSGVKVFVVYAAGSVWAQVSAAVASYYGVQFFELLTIRHPDRLTIAKDGIQSLLAKTKSPCESDYKLAEESLSEFARVYVKPVWITNNIADKRAEVSLKKLKDFYVSLINDNRDKRIDVDDPGSFYATLRVRVIEWIKFRYRYNYIKKVTSPLPENVNTIFMPLHYAPEASLSVRGLYYSNQFALIENISKSIPHNFILCLKEHPQMCGLRESSFYKKIGRIPNVQLLNEQMTSREIIDKCKLVITITGTAGTEAALIGKPAIMLGTTIFNDVMPGVYSFNDTMDKLSEKIVTILEEYEYDRNRVIEVLAGFIASSWDVSQKEFWESDITTNQYEDLVNSVGDILEEVSCVKQESSEKLSVVS